MPCYIRISAHQLLHSIGDRREKHARPRQSQRHMLMLFVDNYNGDDDDDAIGVLRSMTNYGFPPLCCQQLVHTSV